MQRILPMALVSVILSINAQTARSESPSLKHSQFVLESIREQRQSLQSWHFRATGRLSNTHPTDSKHNKAIDFKYLCARDTLGAFAMTAAGVTSCCTPMSVSPGSTYP